jgi:hypothetical protein
MSRVIGRRGGEDGFSTGTSLVAAAAGMLLVALLTLLGMNQFGGASGSGATAGKPSILSQSSAEQQIKLCAEGRDSSYGDPPSSAQQATCVRDLLGEISGTTGSSLPGAP